MTTAKSALTRYQQQLKEADEKARGPRASWIGHWKGHGFAGTSQLQEWITLTVIGKAYAAARDWAAAGHAATQNDMRAMPSRFPSWPLPPETDVEGSPPAGANRLACDEAPIFRLLAERARATGNELERLREGVTFAAAHQAREMRALADDALAPGLRPSTDQAAKNVFLRLLLQAWICGEPGAVRQARVWRAFLGEHLERGLEEP